MRSPRQWLHEWLGLNETYGEIHELEGGGLRLIYHLKDEKAVNRRKRLIAIAMNPWTIGLACVAVAALLTPMVAKLF